MFIDSDFHPLEAFSPGPDGKMCLFKGGGGKGKTPKMAPAATPVTPVFQAQPGEQDPSVVATRDKDRRRRIAAASKTVLTSAQGVSDPAPTASKTLLGS